ncbi:uncharacterized protein HD556DRAFT_1314454 [Suillus plorans]|uniref:Uncharacterized protein n=1 Tax=Suillus plorans TaxID=116603 RepID=A0A9P7D9I3_9AGAM|nr:uncharacterized protein HD556DRAFT_1314454 [Suillus plorans]KAG1785190.1 hypothetical protein HD556DRAFT_1314454 [Suillus plorans]
MPGIQVPLETKVVTWDDGHITILPTVICDGQNVLIEDLRLTKKFAAVPASKPGSRFVTHLKGALSENESLLMEIRSSLAAGKCVIVREAVKPGPLTLTMEYLEKRYGIHSTMPVDMHDMVLWKKNPAQPHVPGMMGDLILGINNPNEQRCVLDCPIAMRARWPSTGPPIIGIQLRTLLFHKLTHDGRALLQAAKSLRSPCDLDDYDAETVTLYPGDLLLRSLEVTEGNTTQTHEYINDTLWRMAALIPRLPPDQLSGKFLNPRKLLARSPASMSSKKKKPVALQSPSYTRAYAVVMKILQHLDICPQDLPDILRGHTSVAEVGEVVDLGSCLLEFTHAA